MRNIRFLLGGGLVAIACGVAFFFGKNLPSASPQLPPIHNVSLASDQNLSNRDKIGFLSTELDLGEHLWNTDVPFALRFQNPTSDDLSIQSVEANCDCVIFDTDALAGRIVSRNGELTIDGKVNTGRHPGTLRRLVTLTDQAGVAYAAHVTLDVYGTWKLSKDVVDFGTIVLGSPDTPLFVEDTIQFISQEDELIEEPGGDAPWITCVSANREGDVSDLLVRINIGKLSPGVNSTQIGFRTSSSVRPDGMVYVRLKALSALKAAPSTVSLIGRETCKTRVSSLDNSPVNLVRIETDCQELDCHIVNNNELMISVQCKETPHKAYSVTVYDDHDNWISIPVSVYLRKE